jgi:hypothetical protein
MSAVKTAAAPTPVAYRLGSGATSGVWFGLSAGRVALVGGGLLIGVVALTVGVPLLVALAPVVLALIVASLQFRGRSVVEWAGPLLGHSTRTASGTRRWVARIPTVDTTIGRTSTKLRLPAEYGRLHLEDCPDDPGIGMLVERSRRRVTAVLEVCGVDRFPLLESEERDVLIAGWGECLSVLTDTDDALVRVQLIDRTRRGAPLPIAVDLASSAELALLTEAVADLAVLHESRLAVQWSFPRLDPETIATIASRCHAVSHALLGARLVSRPLSRAEIAADLTSSLSDANPPLRDLSSVGPMSRRSEWTTVRTDDLTHRSYAIVGWPQTALQSSWLAPLLLAAPQAATCAVALHLERVEPAAAARLSRNRRAKANLDQRDRARLGLASSAALDVAELSGAEMDAELAAGYRTHRLSGVATITVGDPATLPAAERALLQAAAVCRLTLRPLHGQHAEGLAAVLPGCRVRPRGQA